MEKKRSEVSGLCMQLLMMYMGDEPLFIFNVHVLASTYHYHYTSGFTQYYETDYIVSVFAQKKSLYQSPLLCGSTNECVNGFFLSTPPRVYYTSFNEKAKRL